MTEKSSQQQVLLQSVYVELDPVLDGFEGALIELLYRNDTYVVMETAAGTGNQLLELSSTNAQLVHDLLYEHTGIAFTLS